MNTDVNTETANNTISGIECYKLSEEADLASYCRIPINELADLGVSFTPLIPAIKEAAEKSGDGGPFRMVLKSGIDVSDIGAVGAASKLCTVLSIEPNVVLMGVAMTAINKKLRSIEKKQKEMFEYLKLREKAKLMGNMAVLSEILDEYRYNFKNGNYKNHKHIQVQEIKRDAEHSIIFSRQTIESRMAQKQLLHSDRDVKNKIQALKNEFRDYELALYLYSYSAFLEIMLLENFDGGYLDSIVSKINGYTESYKTLSTKCRQLIESDSGTSIRARVLTGVAGFNKLMGNTMSKIPGINETIFDEKLIEAGKKVHDMNTKQTKTTAGMFTEEDCDCIRPFIENIKILKVVFGGKDIAFDKDFVYFESAV